MALVAIGSLWPAVAGAQAVAPRPPEVVLNVSGGFGITYSDGEEQAGDGYGGFASGELVFLPRLPVTPRLYAGTLLTFAREDSCLVAECRVEAKIFFLGCKVRLMAPIPYVGPFVEAGVGLSLGYVRTLDLGFDERTSGATFHIPLSLGLAIGKRHEYTLAFAYLLHPAEDQTGGAVAFGVGIPLP